jgi:poly-beta-1,6-N-acetyl-D-glucosamine synthase
MSGISLTYAVVTPARNEATNLHRLAGCLAGQTAPPARWVVVDTGSTDETPEVVRTLAEEHRWIEHVIEPPSEERMRRGGPIVRAFETGVEALDTLPDIVVKLDADVSFATDYFERLLSAFSDDPMLGIASGRAEEISNGVWHARHTTGASVWGAARAYRVRCLEHVRPLEEQMGWDGIDELKAHMHGWKTKTLTDLPFRHHRPEGIRDGSPWRAWSARGRAAHYMGYRAWYLVLRALHHARADASALGMIVGYGTAAVTRQPVCPDRRVRAQLRQEQRLSRLAARRREAIGEGGR